MFNVPDKFRLRTGHFASTDAYGNNGVFIIPHYKVKDYFFTVIASDGAVVKGGQRWEHISVELTARHRKVDRCPTWQEMCYMKELFWSPDACVVQYHPAKREYVNVHQFVLHLWRPVGVAFPVPDKRMV